MIKKLRKTRTFALTFLSLPLFLPAMAVSRFRNSRDSRELRDIMEQQRAATADHSAPSEYNAFANGAPSNVRRITVQYTPTYEQLYDPRYDGDNTLFGSSALSAPAPSVGRILVPTVPVAQPVAVTTPAVPGPPATFNVVPRARVEMWVTEALETSGIRRDVVDLKGRVAAVQVSTATAHEVAQLNEELDKVKKTVDSTGGGGGEEVGRLNEELEQLKKTVGGIQTDRTKLNDDLEELKRAVGEKQEDDAEFARYNKELDGLKEMVSTTTKDRASTTSDHGQRLASLERTAGGLPGLHTELTEAAARANGLCAQLDELQKAEKRDRDESAQDLPDLKRRLEDIAAPLPKLHQLVETTGLAVAGHEERLVQVENAVSIVERLHKRIVDMEDALQKTTRREGAVSGSMTDGFVLTMPTDDVTPKLERTTDSLVVCQHQGATPCMRVSVGAAFSIVVCCPCALAFIR